MPWGRIEKEERIKIKRFLSSSTPPPLLRVLQTQDERERERRRERRREEEMSICYLAASVLDFSASAAR